MDVVCLDVVVTRNNYKSHTISRQSVNGKINGNVIKWEQEVEDLVNQCANHTNMLEELFPGKYDLES